MKKLIALIVVSSLLSGCVAPNEKQVSADTPASLHPAAASLKGSLPANLYVKSQQTVPDEVLQTRTFQRVASVAAPAVVSVYVKTQTPVKVRLLPIKFRFTGIPLRLPGIGLGSGFFIHPKGYILTNEHVIRNAKEIHVMTHSGLDFTASLIASDPVYDLALLKIDSTVPLKFAFLPMGDSAEMFGGDHVIAVGNPLGFGHTVTAGIISHNGRNLYEEKNPDGRYIRFLQTDVAINPGSSGGPLISLGGAWIGVNTAQIDNSAGIGLAVPAAQVQEFLTNVLEGRGRTVE